SYKLLTMLARLEVYDLVCEQEPLRLITMGFLPSSAVGRGAIRTLAADVDDPVTGIDREAVPMIVVGSNREALVNENRGLAHAPLGNDKRDAFGREPAANYNIAAISRAFSSKARARRLIIRSPRRRGRAGSVQSQCRQPSRYSD